MKGCPVLNLQIRSNDLWVFFSVYSSIFMDLSGSKKNIVNDISDLLLDFVYMDLLSILASQGNSPTIVFMLHTCLFSVL